MSDLTKLLVKLSKEGLTVKLVPWSEPFHNTITGIQIYLYKGNERVASAVNYNELELMLTDGIEYRINELYNRMIKG